MTANILKFIKTNRAPFSDLYDPPGGLEGVGLLFDGVAHHLPEALRHGEAQVARRDLARVDDAALPVGGGKPDF